MPGQFINKGTNPGGKVTLVNNSNAGNFTLFKGTTPGGSLTVYAKNQSAGNPGFDFQYRASPYPFTWSTIGLGSNITSATCAELSGFTGFSGIDSFDFRIVRTGTSQTVSFDWAYSTTCPAYVTPNCIVNVPVDYYAPAINVAFTVKVAASDYENCP
jgi:hypothetical protein